MRSLGNETINRNWLTPVLKWAISVGFRKLSSDLRDLPVPPAFDHKAHSNPPSFFYTTDLFVSVKTSHHCCCLCGLAPVPDALCLVPSGLLGKDHPFGWAAKASGPGGGVFILAWVVSLQLESITRAGLDPYTGYLNKISGVLPYVHRC